MPKKENYDKNHGAAQADRKRRQELNQTPEHRKAQLQYRINSITEAVAAGRKKWEDVGAEIGRLNEELDHLGA